MLARVAERYTRWPQNGIVPKGRVGSNPTPGMTQVDTFAEAEALVDGVGPRPAGSDAERRAARHLAERLEGLGREVVVEPFSVWPAWPVAYSINAILAVVGSVLSVSSAKLGTGLVLLATVLTFLDLSGITPTTRRLLGRRASQNVVSWGERERPGALLLVAHYDSGPTRTWPLRPMFWALLVLLACCVLRVGGMSGTALTVLQFLPTVALILYVPLLLDIALSPAAPGENDNASGVALVLRLAERLDFLEGFGVHVLLTGSQKAMAQGMPRVPEEPPQAVRSRPDRRVQRGQRGKRRASANKEGGPAAHGPLASATGGIGGGNHVRQSRAE